MNDSEKKYRICAIGDTHGRFIWKSIVIQEADADLFIFIGDLFDISIYLYIWKNIKYIV